MIKNTAISIPLVAVSVTACAVLGAALSELWRPLFLSVMLSGILLGLVAAGYSRLLLRLGNVFGNLVIWIGKTASWIILLLIAMIMFDVITRKIEFIKVRNAEITETYGFSVSFILQDLQWHTHGILLLMTLGFAYMLNAHVRVDIFRESASRRRQAWIEALGITFFAVPFLMVMIGFSWDFFAASFKGWEGSESMVGLGWRWIIKSFLIWGFCIAFLAALSTLLRCLGFLYGDGEVRTDAEEALQFFTDADALPKLILAQSGNNDAAGRAGER